MPFSTANHDCGYRSIAQCLSSKVLLVFADHQTCHIDIRVGEKRVDGMSQHGLAAKRSKLLRDRASGTIAFAGSDNEGSYAHGRALSFVGSLAEGVLRRSMKMDREVLNF